MRISTRKIRALLISLPQQTFTPSSYTLHALLCLAVPLCCRKRSFLWNMYKWYYWILWKSMKGLGDLCLPKKLVFWCVFSLKPNLNYSDHFPVAWSFENEWENTYLECKSFGHQRPTGLKWHKGCTKDVFFLTNFQKFASFEMIFVWYWSFSDSIL